MTTSISAAEIVKAAIQAWEANDAEKLASCLADTVVWHNLFPQPLGKQRIIAFMQAVMRAFPDWAFNATFLNEHPVRGQGTLAHFVIRITGTHRGDFVVPGLPPILPSDTRIALPLRHLDVTVNDEQVTTIWTDFSPTGLEEILAQLGMRLP
jgi:ketosteroid isomerase-like protein